MSCKIREWLKKLSLLERTTHEDRLQIDQEIERQTGENCDVAVERKLIAEQEFYEIVMKILRKKKQEISMVC